MMPVLFLWQGSSGSPPPPPPPAPVIGLPHQGGPGGSSHGLKRGVSTFVDVEHWTRRGMPSKVRTLAGTDHLRPRSGRAKVRQFAPSVQSASARSTSAAPAFNAAACEILILPIRLAASVAEQERRAPPQKASARTSERQDVADILTIIELFEDDLDE